MLLCRNDSPVKELQQRISHFCLYLQYYNYKIPQKAASPPNVSDSMKLFLFHLFTEKKCAT